MAQHKNILIVEDDKAIREMMKNILEALGYSTQTAANGKEGIAALLKQPRPDLVLLDMMMPEMTGWDFLDVLRSDITTRDIPVVVVSAYNELARSVKPNAFVPKPVQLKALLKAIEECAA